MEQLFYIVLELAKEENHVRGIAQALGINHMTSSRFLQELYERNVIDFEKKGRNKVYHIKNTQEARNFLIMAEIYRLNDMIDKHPVLRKIAKEVQQSDVSIALLFGSYAKQKATKKSDIDLYIDNKEEKKSIENLHTRLSVQTGRLQGPLAREIKKNHVIIKGAEDYYDKHFFKKTV